MIPLIKSGALKITLLTITLILCGSLFACGGPKNGGRELALDIRAGLLKASGLDMTAEVTADYGDRVYQFIFTYAGNAGEGTLTLTAPENVAGLKMRVSVSTGAISYDGAELDTGKLTGDGLSPAEAVPVLINQWQSGYISGCNLEKLGAADTVAVTTDVTETVKARTWFDVKTHLPLRSELSENGRMVIACTFSGVAVEQGS
jgi:hypothetical protein